MSRSIQSANMTDLDGDFLTLARFPEIAHGRKTGYEQAYRLKETKTTNQFVHRSTSTNGNGTDKLVDIVRYHMQPKNTRDKVIVHRYIRHKYTQTRNTGNVLKGKEQTAK